MLRSLPAALLPPLCTQGVASCRSWSADLDSAWSIDSARSIMHDPRQLKSRFVIYV